MINLLKISKLNRLKPTWCSWSRLFGR